MPADRAREERVGHALAPLRGEKAITAVLMLLATICFPRPEKDLADLLAILRTLTNRGRVSRSAR